MECILPLIALGLIGGMLALLFAVFTELEERDRRRWYKDRGYSEDYYDHRRKK